MFRTLKKVRQVFRRDGVQGLYRGVLHKIEYFRRNQSYKKWIAKYEALSDADLKRITDEIEGFRAKPLISVLMPVYNVDEKWLRIAIESVLRQSYPYWEFCIVDDDSPSPHIRKVLDEYAGCDSRIKLVYRAENGHISAASNSALRLATGEFAGLLDHDDELSPHALFFIAKEINRFPEVSMIYSDEDKIDTRGRRTSPSLKPDWSPELFYSLNLITHLSVYRTSVLREIGGFREGFEGSQDYDLGLRVSERTGEANIRHIPRILYHWRSIPGSVALDSSEKEYAHDRARKSIYEHFKRSGVTANVTRGYRELHRVRYGLPDPVPLVSLIVSGTNAYKMAVDGICKNTKYPRVEIIDGRAQISSETDLGPNRPVTDFAALNAAAFKANGSLLCFIDANTVVSNKNWLDELVGLAMQKKVGAVGPRIVFPNGRIKSAGLIVGINGGVGRAHYSMPKYKLGNFYRLQVAHNVSALSIDCFLLAKEVFESVGAFNAGVFPHEYGDVDLCLQLLERGRRNVWNPWSELCQTARHEFSRGPELDALKARWPKYFKYDPYYNPNLTENDEDLSFAFPPRISKI